MGELSFKAAERLAAVLALALLALGEARPPLGTPDRSSSVRFALPDGTPIAGDDTLLPLPSGDRHGDLLVIVAHCPTEIATVRLKDVPRVVDADLAEPLVVLSLILVHPQPSLRLRGFRN